MINTQPCSGPSRPASSSTLRARQPAAADGPVAEDVAGDPGGRERGAAGVPRVALAAVGGVGALEVGRGRLGSTGPWRPPPAPARSRPAARSPAALPPG